MATYAYTPEPNTPGAGARVRFEAISEAFNLVKAQAGTWILTMLIFLAITFAVSMALTFLLAAVGLSQPLFSTKQPGTGAVILGNVISFLVNSVVEAVMVGGLYKMALKQIRGESISPGDLFSGTDSFGQLFVATILIAICVYGAAIFLILPGLIVAGLLMLTIPLIADKRMGAVDAMKASWNAMKRDIWSPIGFLIVAGLLSGLGVLACGIGILFTAPIAYLSVCIVYEDFFGENSETSRYTPGIEMPLPPGSTFSPSSASETDRL